MLSVIVGIRDRVVQLVSILGGVVTSARAWARLHHCVGAACVYHDDSSEPSRCACVDGWMGFDCTAAATGPVREQRNTGRLGSTGAAVAGELQVRTPLIPLLRPYWGLDGFRLKPD